MNKLDIYLASLDQYFHPVDSPPVALVTNVEMISEFKVSDGCGLIPIEIQSMFEELVSEWNKKHPEYPVMPENEELDRSIEKWNIGHPKRKPALPMTKEVGIKESFWPFFLSAVANIRNASKCAPDTRTDIEIARLEKSIEALSKSKSLMGPLHPHFTKFNYLASSGPFVKVSKNPRQGLIEYDPLKKFRKKHSINEPIQKPKPVSVLDLRINPNLKNSKSTKNTNQTEGVDLVDLMHKSKQPRKPKPPVTHFQKVQIDFIQILDANILDMKVILEDLKAEANEWRAFAKNKSKNVDDFGTRLAILACGKTISDVFGITLSRTTARLVSISLDKPVDEDRAREILRNSSI